MRDHLYGILILLVILSNCCSSESIESRKVIISGEVVGYNKDTDQDFIEFKIIDPFSTHQNRTVFLDEDGCFNIEIERIYPQELLIHYKYLFAVYTFPGASINVSIDAKILSSELNKLGDVYDLIQVSGDTEKFNKDFQNFQRLYSDSLFNSSAEIESIINLDEDQYRAYIDYRTEHYYLIIEESNNSTNASRQFREWVKVWIKTNALNDLISYRYLRQFYGNLGWDDKKSLKPQNEYYSFLDENDCFNEDYMVTIEYFRFLFEYYLYFYNDLIPMDLQNQQHELAKIQDHLTATNITKLYIQRNTSGFLQEVLLATFYHQLLDWKNLQIYDKLYYPQLIGRNDYCQTIETKYNSIVQGVDKPTLLVTKHSNSFFEVECSKILSNIIERFPENVILFGFWSPDCDSCISEMTFSNKIREKLRFEAVVFVHLAVNCSEYSWKTTISDNKLTGKHYLLTDEQYANLSDKFEFSGIPHYVLVDKKGMVVNNNAPRPSEEKNLEKLINILLEQ